MTMNYHVAIKIVASLQQNSAARDIALLLLKQKTREREKERTSGIDPGGGIHNSPEVLSAIHKFSTP